MKYRHTGKEEIRILRAQGKCWGQSYAQITVCSLWSYLRGKLIFT